MNANDRKQGGVGALLSGLGRALQWRLLLLWALGLALPALVATLPLWRALSARLDHSVHAQALAERFDFAWMYEAVARVLRENGDVIAGSGIASVALALLLAPWLTGMAVASIRAGQVLGFANLLQLGLREYGRMARMLLWALVPVGLALVVGGAVSNWAEDGASIKVLSAEAENLRRVGLIVTAVLFVLAHATLEAGRGVLAADPARRSAVKAWGRGVLLLARRPLAVLVVYVGTMLAGEGLALGFAFARTQVNAASVGGMLAGVLLVQLIVAAIAWGRVARLYGMAALARDAQHRHATRHARREAAAKQHAVAQAQADMAEPAVA